MSSKMPLSRAANKTNEDISVLTAKLCNLASADAHPNMHPYQLMEYASKCLYLHTCTQTAAQDYILNSMRLRCLMQSGVNGSKVNA